ncbi:phosphopantetheine-binding protein [Streptomyces sp. Tue 6430]|nr:phosphopantetheine-binding protein [Streptomyces sp. Tue 6430]
MLTGHPGVAQAAAVVRENQDGDKRIVGYVMPGPGAAGDEAGVRALLAELPGYLRGRLPDYMVPSAVIPLSEIPLTPNGKLDRGALPAEDTHTEAGREPRDSREERLCALFAELLAVEGVGIDDDFFALGGHSLLATRLSARIRSEFGLDVPLRTIIKYPTVAELASLLLIGAPRNSPTRSPSCCR